MLIKYTAIAFLIVLPIIAFIVVLLVFKKTIILKFDQSLWYPKYKITVIPISRKWGVIAFILITYIGAVVSLLFYIADNDQDLMISYFLLNLVIGLFVIWTLILSPIRKLPLSETLLHAWSLIPILSILEFTNSIYIPYSLNALPLFLLGVYVSSTPIWFMIYKVFSFETSRVFLNLGLGGLISTVLIMLIFYYYLSTIINIGDWLIGISAY